LRRQTKKTPNQTQTWQLFDQLFDRFGQVVFKLAEFVHLVKGSTARHFCFAKKVGPVRIPALFFKFGSQFEFLDFVELVELLFKLFFKFFFKFFFTIFFGWAT
jgi:hypothetical protein